jgi:hypothetical protein
MQDVDFYVGSGKSKMYDKGKGEKSLCRNIDRRCKNS